MTSNISTPAPPYNFKWNSPKENRRIYCCKIFVYVLINMGKVYPFLFFSKLIKRYTVKCQEFDAQVKKSEDAKKKSDQYKR